MGPEPMEGNLKLKLQHNVGSSHICSGLCADVLDLETRQCVVEGLGCIAALLQDASPVILTPSLVCRCAGSRR